VPDIAEMDSYEMLCEDWGSACLITHGSGPEGPYRGERRDDLAIVRTAAPPGGLRRLIRADYLARPVSRKAAP
jgi:hypothetical protein